MADGERVECLGKKTVFTDRSSAKKKLKAINREKGKKHMKQTYYCEDCQGYHLSSMSKAEYLHAIENKAVKTKNSRILLMDDDGRLYEFVKVISKVRERNKTVIRCEVKEVSN